MHETAVSAQTAALSHRPISLLQIHWHPIAGMYRAKYGPCLPGRISAEHGLQQAEEKVNKYGVNG